MHREALMQLNMVERILSLLILKKTNRFEQLGSKKYDALTSEMEIATYNAYKNAQNTDKRHFPSWFSRIWINYRNMQGANVQLTEKSLKKLSKDLKTLRDDYSKTGKNLAAGHAKMFIEEIDKILEVERNQKVSE